MVCSVMWFDMKSVDCGVEARGGFIQMYVCKLVYNTIHITIPFTISNLMFWIFLDLKGIRQSESVILEN